MKKHYLSVIALIATGVLSAQSAFFTSTTYKGAFPVTDGNTGIGSNDWTAGWSNFDPDNVVYPAVDSVINNNITSNRTLSPAHTYQLVGIIAVTGGATLTILPGTVIRGDKTSKSCLIISAGSKINAQGTVLKPIIFTSNEETSVNGRSAGDWGGLIILGKAVINSPCATCNTSPNQNYIEGFVSAFPEILYGGSNNADNSGMLSYVRIEYGGVALSSTPNSEINGLTLGGVGSGTTIDHIQVSFSGDDSYEWFGGFVDAKYLIAFRGLDDDFDTDFGFSGRIQFGLGIRDKDISDAAGDSNGFESDNFDPGSGRFPMTSAIFSNITSIGPKRDGTVSLPVGEKFERGIYTRRNTAISVCNSIIVGWEKGWHLKDAATLNNYNSPVDSGIVANNTITTDVSIPFVLDATAGSTAPWYSSYATNYSINILTTVAQVDFVNGFPAALEGTPDFRLKSTSTEKTGASFAYPKFVGQVLSVNDRRNNSFGNITLYPNPATNNSISIAMELIQASNITITIYDIVGKVISTSLIKNMNSGNNTTFIDISTVPSGLYFANILADGFAQTVRFSVVK